MREKGPDAMGPRSDKIVVYAKSPWFLRVKPGVISHYY